MGIDKLTIGRLIEAWRDYPRAKKEIALFPSGKPIFIGGTHRSGTTWFARMLAVPGLWYIHEPFNPNNGVWKEAFPYQPPEIRNAAIDSYLNRLLDGDFAHLSYVKGNDHMLMPMRLFGAPIQRVMIKDPLACLLTGYLETNFDVKAIVLFRHPAGFVSSINRLGWPSGSFLAELLKRRDIMDIHLHPFADLMMRHSDRKDVESAAVLHGVLNQVQWNQIQAANTIAWYQFEELCQDPVDMFQSIFERFSLPYNEATRRRHIVHCLGGSVDVNDYKTHDVKRNSAAMADSWKNQLDPDDVAQIRKIWDSFDIPLYRSNDQWAW